MQDHLHNLPVAKVYALAVLGVALYSFHLRTSFLPSAADLNSADST